ncbi:carbohydrate ABC transporter substrate-binding protein (CUT1 family) [Isoptericola sp. CG 20/1183]|uniref:Carbohydrate ABC transporter substrate-binding protein (CUT1 family) n=1 Tax=Isoptericola halotolerans TaxID=300560 RepID=A0ABX5EHN9_9MICO|nr:MULTISPECIES: sugar ABC transporter substrate-binding protein [Isoptericola]PRZ04189.1 carbohydrate ABC transporter substrate-binding protein (CUT1 family) [Isoptericola sp. CG 20/1183]PRZ09986.1 carbohydrate ABC transporter substrate-binding protein (CUT1 family) [Isoptericola halotolerans]
MTARTTTRTTRWLRGTAVAGVLALGLTACASGETDSGEATQDADSALEEGGEITVWAWDPTLESVAADFEAEHPNVTVNLENVGTGNDQYTALQNAIAAGDGVPDVAQIEFYALPQFALSEALADLTAYGADELDGTFTPGPWGAVQQEGGVYALPTDSGPMALFYNKRVFDEHGIEVPTTWEEYVEAARTLHEADPDAYLTNDVGDAGFTTSMIWQAGGRPYQVEGTDVTIDFTDEGTQQFTSTWQSMLDEELVAPVGSWSDEWYQGLSDGSIASLVIGAWMRGNLESSVPDASGDWAVAPMPQWESGEEVTSENGGSSLAIPAASENADLAWAFLEYATVGDGIATRVDEGAFPATVAELEDPAFREQEFEYFGGQQVNEVLADSSANVAEGWQYLPFQVYANSIFNDTVGQAYVSDTTLTDGLTTWQEQSTTYGNDQGFTVNQ